MRRLFLPLVVILAWAAPARAEIALLANGSTLKVEARRRQGEELYLALRGGGEVGVPAAFVLGFVPDEVVEEVAPARTRVELETLVVAAARRHGLEPALVRAVVAVESGFEPEAVSPKGAQGLMQLMPRTAASLGVEDAFDPAQNLDGGTRHLSELISRYRGDVKRALAAYNAGPTAVERHGGVPPYAETRAYVNSVLQRYRKGS